MALIKNLELEIMKQALGIYSGLQKIRNWTLWRGQTPPPPVRWPTCASSESAISCSRVLQKYLPEFHVYKFFTVRKEPG
jgi:hypothetical protein